MENKKKKSTGLLLSILGVISLVLITAGVTYAFFSYAKQGEKENTLSTGSITFIYNETSDALNIQDALPKADSVGTAENANNAYTFTVTSTTPSTAYINYIVTAKMDANSTLSPDQVKLYLTSTLNSGNEGIVGVPSTGLLATGEKTGTAQSVLAYSELADANATNYPAIFANNNVAPTQGVTEKVIYVGQVPSGRSTTNYLRTFKLNMWLKGVEATYECQVNGVKDENIETESACTATTGGQWVNVTDTTGLSDYSAYEFVKKSAVTNNNAISVATLVSGGNILKSVDYYKGVEDGSITAADWDRIAYVDYTNKTVLTRSQAVALTLATDTNGFAYTTGNDATATVGTATMTANEQYYPLKGGTFKVTINVYAEGATTYSVPTGN